MKNFLNKMKTHFSKTLKNEHGQGMLEYILILVVVVALVMMFKSQIRDAVKGQVEKLGSSIGGFTGD